MTYKKLQVMIINYRDYKTFDIKAITEAVFHELLPLDSLDKFIERSYRTLRFHAPLKAVSYKSRFPRPL